jgi:hypothetical protein
MRVRLPEFGCHAAIEAMPRCMHEQQRLGPALVQMCKDSMCQAGSCLRHANDNGRTCRYDSICEQLMDVIDDPGAHRIMFAEHLADKQESAPAIPPAGKTAKLV